MLKADSPLAKILHRKTKNSLRKAEDFLFAPRAPQHSPAAQLYWASLAQLLLSGYQDFKGSRHGGIEASLPRRLGRLVPPKLYAKAEAFIRQMSIQDKWDTLYLLFGVQIKMKQQNVLF